MTNAQIRSFKYEISSINRLSFQKIKKSKNYKITKKKNCFFVSFENCYLTIKFFDWLKKTTKWTTTNLTKFVVVNEIFHNTIAAIINISIIVSQINLKITILNDIIICNNNSTYNRIFTIIDAYSIVWKLTNKIINVFKNQWMSIFIILNVKSKFAKIYFLNLKNRRFVNKKFDFLH